MSKKTLKEALKKKREKERKKKKGVFSAFGLARKAKTRKALLEEEMKKK